MWKIIIKEVGGGSSYTIIENSIPLTFGQVISYWQYNEEFRAFFIDVLIKNDFTAYRWETPPISKSLINRIFEFVLLNSPDLDRNQNDKAFREYLNTANEDIISFSNLGKDATLIVPCNKNQHTKYRIKSVFI